MQYYYFIIIDEKIIIKILLKFKKNKFFNNFLKKIKKHKNSINIYEIAKIYLFNYFSSIFVKFCLK